MEFSNLFTTVVSSTVENMRIGDYMFFDIETVPGYDNFENVPSDMQDAWIALCSRRYTDDLKRGKSYGELYIENAALMAEFNKVVCISAGRIVDNEHLVASLFLPSDRDNDESLIRTFCTFLNKQSGYKLTGFNIHGFDIPVLFKKCVKYGLKIPQQLNTWNIKPWERQSVDIYDIWKCGSHSSSASLQTVSTFLDCGNPKENVCGCDVNTLYNNDNLDGIIDYCEGDVKATMCILEKLLHLNVI